MSKFEELVVFSEVKKNKQNEASQLIKSPTFGLLGTDRVQKAAQDAEIEKLTPSGLIER